MKNEETFSPSNKNENKAIGNNENATILKNQRKANKEGLTLGIVEDVGLLYIVGHLGFRFLMLAGLLGIYFIIESSQEKGKFSEIINKKHLILFLYLIAGLVLLSTYKYLIFYITASLILCFISFVLVRNHI